MTRPVLYLRFAAHIRLQGGAIYLHHVVDAAGKVIGSMSSHLDKKKKTTTKTYSIGDQTFSDIEDFRKAYDQTLRDQEWDAAKPKDENDN